jgi:hypothetical protein
VWSNLSEDLVTDSDSYADLNPQHSNDWSIIVNTMCDRCDIQMSATLAKFVDELKRTIGVNQLINASIVQQQQTISPSSSSSTLDAAANSDASQLLDKISTSKMPAATRSLDRVYNLSSSMMEKASNKMKSKLVGASASDNYSLPLDKRFLDYIMDVSKPKFQFAVQFCLFVIHSLIQNVYY